MDIRSRTLALSSLLSLTTTTPTYAELLIQSSESYTNSVVLENSDLILNYGEFSNRAIVENQGESEFINYGLVFNYDSMLFDRNSGLLNYGDFDNFGDISASLINNHFNGSFENQSLVILHEGIDTTGSMIAAELNNSGEFNNNGIIDTISSFQGFNLTNSNVFNNNGTIYTNGPTQITNSGVFNNSGEFNSSSDTALNITNSGEFINATNLQLGNNLNPEEAGSIINTQRFVNHAAIHGGESINNSGLFENDGNIDGINSFENSGHILNYGFIGVVSDLINSGTSNFNNLYNSSIEAHRIENRGVFDNHGIVVLRERFDDTTGNMVATELNNSDEFNNDGTIEAYSVYHEFNLINSNVFNNNGTIYTNGPTQITNSGVFNNSGELNSASDAPLNITNSGEFINATNLHLGSQWNPEEAGSIINTDYFINHANIFGGKAINNNGYFENNGFINHINTVENHGDIINSRRISVDIELENSATSIFHNLDRGFVETQKIENSGIFNNQGVIVLHERFDDTTRSISSAEINNSGEFNNDGTIDTYSSFQGFNLTNSNVFSNNGTIYTNGPTQITNSGVFYNTGEFNSASGSPLDIINSGEFINTSNLQLGENSNLEGAGSIINTDRFYNNAEIYDGNEINNSGFFDNQGNINNINSFENSGDVVNSGFIGVVTDLVNSAASSLNNLYSSFVEAQRVENLGVFDNQGVVVLHDGIDTTGSMVAAELNNSGEFSNDGFIDTYSSFQGFNLTNNNIFNNNGTIYTNGSTQITNYGIFNNLGSLNTSSNSLSIDNYGTFYNLGSFNVSSNSLSIDNYGSFINSESMILGDFYSGHLGQIVNRGSFVNNDEIFDGELFLNIGHLENNGDIAVLTFENSGDVVNTGGIGTFYGTNRLTNLANGTFTNLYGSGAGSTYLDNQGVFDNQSIVTMHESYDFATGQRSPAELNNTGTFNNSGTVHSDSDIGFNLTNSGEFTNTYWASIYSHGDTQITNSGDFVNRGSIDVDYGSLNINNSGSFSTSANYDLAGNGGNIDNTGTFINHSSISDFNNISSSGQLVNEGEISANTVTISGTLEGGGDVSVSNGLYITESGTLSTTGLFDIMDVSGDLFIDGTIEFDTELYFFADDRMNVFGDVVLGSSSILDVSSIDLWAQDVGSTFDLLLADSITGSFDDFYYDAMLGDGLSLEWGILDSYGQDLLRLSVVSSVPLPAAFWLFLSGAIGLLSVSRKRRM
jgi:hypothetical protein